MKILNGFLNLERWSANHGLRPLGRIPGIKPLLHRSRRFLHQAFHPEIVLHRGHRIGLDTGDSLRLSLNEWEPEIATLMRQILKPGDTAVDVGAHIGVHTLEMARLVGPKGLVYAFEPNPQAFHLLCRNIARNGLYNVLPFNMGLWGTQTFMTLNHNHRGSAGSSVWQFPNRKHDQTSVVPMINLDWFNLNPKLIKMDIEGSETQAIQGMSQTLTNSHLIMEWNPDLPPTEAWPLLTSRRNVSIIPQSGEPYPISEPPNVGLCNVWSRPESP